jgi:hypothetical protein
MDRDLHYPLQRIIGALFVVGGLWHAASPWIAGYSGDRAAVVSNVAAGLALAAVGVGYLVFRGARVLNWAAGAIGLWVMVAPAILGVPDWMALNEAYWGGPITLVLVAIAAYDLRFHRPIDEAERAARPADYATGTILTDRTAPGPAAARANESRLRFVPTQLHSAIDYLWAAAVIAMPWVLGYDSMFAVAMAPVFAGLFVIFYSVFTQYEYGVWGVFTMRNHLWMDFGVGLFLALSPWLFGFAREVWIPHVAFGCFAMIAALVTSTVPRWTVAPVEWFPEPRDYPLASR